MNHSILLSIGSNTYARRNLRKARRLLAAAFPNITYTRAITCKPYGKHYTRDFVNILATCHTCHSHTRVQHMLKTIEKVMGRLPDDKLKGRVVIDIDLLKFDNIRFKHADWQRDYVKNLLPFVDISPAETQA